MFAFTAVLLSCVLGAATAPEHVEWAQPQGVDVASYQGNVSWASVAAAGVDFAYIKATEGTYYTNPYFAQQYNGAYNNGLIRGAYHFAIPNSNASAASQAEFFVAHGGGWSSNGKTLPGALDIEYNPYSGGTCYDLSQSAMVDWIQSFSDTYYSLTYRYPVIYTTTDWWTTCTGNFAGFAKNNTLWIARWSSAVGTLPAGWSCYSFWQFTDSSQYPPYGDGNVWNGDAASLRTFAAS